MGGAKARAEPFRVPQNWAWGWSQAGGGGGAAEGRSQPEFQADPGRGAVQARSGAGLTHRSAGFAFPRRSSRGRICARSLGSACCRSPRSVRTEWRAGSQQVIPRGGSGLAEGSRTYLPPLLAGPALRVKHHHCKRERGRGGKDFRSARTPSPPLSLSRTPSSLPPGPGAAYWGRTWRRCRGPAGS